MYAIRNIVLRSPLADLKAYLTPQYINLAIVDWSKREDQVKKQILTSVDKLDETSRGRLIYEADRTHQMTSDMAQTAMMSFVDVQTRAKLKSMKSEYARALWLYRMQPQTFDQIFQVILFDQARSSSTWDGFQTSKGQRVKRDSVSLNAFRGAVQSLFDEGRGCEIDIFDRDRSADPGATASLVQVTVFRERLAKTQLVFEKSKVLSKIHHPVVELGLTYDPGTGVIEVVCDSKAKRQYLAQLFDEHLLGNKQCVKPLPRRRFNMHRFIDRQPFNTDAQDGIRSVSLFSIQVVPANGAAPIEFHSRSKSSSALKELESLLENCDPGYFGLPVIPADSGKGVAGLLEPPNLFVREAVLLVRCEGDRECPKGAEFKIKFRHPDGCNLTEKTAKRRLVLNKYLEIWGLLAKEES